MTLLGHRVTLTGGPNVCGYALLGAVCLVSLQRGSLWPLFAVGGLVLLCVCIAVPLALWDERERRRMLEDFPHDPYIQAKYSRSGRETL
jgi:hypothetical protein